MAGEHDDRTEAPTARRLARAREAGQVPISREAPPTAALAVTVLLLALAAPAAARRLVFQLGLLLTEAHRFDPTAAGRLAAAAALLGAVPFALAGAAASFAAVLMQTGFLVRPLGFWAGLSRLSPRRALVRFASLATALEAAKALLKLLAAGAAAAAAVHAALPLLPAMLLAPLTALPSRLLSEVLRLLSALLLVQAAIAGFDIVRTRIVHTRELRMTRHEVRDELKETEGNPHVRARIRRLRLQRARRRMMQAVPRATVVVTNPTHYAVALAYQRGSAAAPRVVAKGTEEVAARIRDLARAHGVPLVANPPLARALHAVELDAEIPRELYQAVAELIAYVWRLRRRAL